MSSNLLRTYIREALVLDAGAAGTASLDVPTGQKDIDIDLLATAAMKDFGATSKEVQRILAFNEMVYNVAFQGGSSNAWQAIAEKMMKQWGFNVPDQLGSDDSSGVTVFWDVSKGSTFYSVKATFKAGVNPNNPSAGPSSSPIKIDSVVALLIKSPNVGMLGNIGCVCNLGKPDDPIIKWGEATKPIPKASVVSNINKYLSKDEELSKRFLDAIDTQPADDVANKLISDINNFFVSLGVKKGRMNLSWMREILGPDPGEMIGTLKLVPPDTLFNKTMGSGIKDGTRADGTEVASSEDRKDFMRRMRSVARTLSASEMDDIIDTAMKILGVSSGPSLQAAGFRRLTLPTQNYLKEHLALRMYVSSMLKEELTKSDKKEIDKLIKRAIEKDRAEQKKLIRKEIEDELVKSLGKSFFRQPGRIRKTIIDVCQEELAKEMQKGSKMEKSVVDVTKKVMSAWHEMLYKQQNIINRIKI